MMEPGLGMMSGMHPQQQPPPQQPGYGMGQMSQGMMPNHGMSMGNGMGGGPMSEGNMGGQMGGPQYGYNPQYGGGGGPKPYMGDGMSGMGQQAQGQRMMSPTHQQ